MKTSRAASVLALAAVALLVIVGLNWLGSRESHASAASPPIVVEEPHPPRDPLVAATGPAAIRDELPVPAVVDSAPPSSVAPQAMHYAFLPDDLQPLATMVPERLKAFDAATPAEQLLLGRDLLVHSIAVIQCATETGPIPKGAEGDGDLSYTGRDGKWAFQINSWTFHLYESQFPEYPEYIALLNSAYDDQMVPLQTSVELPADLAERIRQRAQEALSWL